MISLINKIAVIIDGGSGIGKATALLFAKQGAAIQIIDVNKEEAGSTAQQIKELK